MSHEGFVLVVRVVVVLSLIVATATVRTFIGRNQRRAVVMVTGWLAGFALGIAVSYLLPSSLKMQESALFVVGCSLLGWTGAWFFARAIPRETN